MKSLSRSLLHSVPFLLLPVLLLTPARAQENNNPPKGFTALFDGRDIKDWTFGLTKSPSELAGMPSDERAKMMDELHKHWRVENGELVSDGKDPYLATPRDYGDFEMWVDWKIGQYGDSGIYLRGVPQVQIWDPSDPKQQHNGCGKGSGALWNNKIHERFPPEVADKPIGEWNRMFIRIVGPYVTVRLNDKKVVDNVPLENYYDPKIPIYMRGPIYLQTHGNVTRFRNVFVREIPPKEANRALAKIGQDDSEFTSLFNGKDLSGWIGSTDVYEVVKGNLVSKAGKHGNMFTKDTYDNFIARLEFKLPKGGNNGLALRSPITDKEVAYEGMETQILDNTAAKYANLHEYQFHGSLYGLAPAIKGYLRPVGQWNYEEVTVKGDELTVAVNGFEILKTNIAKVREKPMDGKAHPGASRSDGHFGLLGHTDPVAFRNIRIKRLTTK
jgi:3-keto-disaccharide hydrolase